MIPIIIQLLFYQITLTIKKYTKFINNNLQVYIKYNFMNLY